MKSDDEINDPRKKSVWEISIKIGYGLIFLIKFWDCK